MSDWHPQVVKLDKIFDLEGSDFLQITTILGTYPSIIRKGDYKEGQLVSFIPYDSIVPDNEQFQFLRSVSGTDENGNKITKPLTLKNRTIKAKNIRGAYSEGLIVAAPEGFAEGDSIIDYFSLTKRVYDEELDELKSKYDTKGGKIPSASEDTESAPKSFSLFKYDLEGMAKYAYAFEEGEEVVIHEKVEGQNCCFVYTDDRLYVRSRNLFKKKPNPEFQPKESYWWSIPERYSLEEKLKEYPGLVIWGELYGTIKGWKYDCQTVNGKLQVNFRVFDIWDINTNKFLDWDQVVEISNKIGLPTVPELYCGPWKTDHSFHPLAEGKSVIGECVKEGWVMRTIKESYHPKLHRKIIKLKGKEYKLIKG